MRSSGKRTPLRAPFVIVRFLQSARRGIVPEKPGLLLHHVAFRNSAPRALSRRGWRVPGWRKHPWLLCRAWEGKFCFSSSPPSAQRGMRVWSVAGTSKQKFRASRWGEDRPSSPRMLWASASPTRRLTATAPVTRSWHRSVKSPDPAPQSLRLCSRRATYRPSNDVPFHGARGTNFCGRLGNHLGISRL